MSSRPQRGGPGAASAVAAAGAAAAGPPPPPRPGRGRRLGRWDSRRGLLYPPWRWPPGPSCCPSSTARETRLSPSFLGTPPQSWWPPPPPPRPPPASPYARHVELIRLDVVDPLRRDASSFASAYSSRALSAVDRRDPSGGVGAVVVAAGTLPPPPPAPPASPTAAAAAAPSPAAAPARPRGPPAAPAARIEGAPPPGPAPPRRRRQRRYENPVARGPGRRAGARRGGGRRRAAGVDQGGAANGRDHRDEGDGEGGGEEEDEAECAEGVVHRAERAMGGAAAATRALCRVLRCAWPGATKGARAARWLRGRRPI